MEGKVVAQGKKEVTRRVVRQRLCYRVDPARASSEILERYRGVDQVEVVMSAGTRYTRRLKSETLVLVGVVLVLHDVLEAHVCFLDKKSVAATS